MSQRSQVSRIALWCQKVKGVVVSQWVTGIGIELSQTKVWTAKKGEAEEKIPEPGTEKEIRERKETWEKSRN